MWATIFKTEDWGGQKTNCPLDNHTGTVGVGGLEVVTPTKVEEGAFPVQRLGNMVTRRIRVIIADNYQILTTDLDACVGTLHGLTPLM